MTRTRNSVVDKHYEDVVNLVKSLSQPSMCATEVSERFREACELVHRASILEAVLRMPKYRFIIDHYRQLDKLMLNPDIEFKGWVNEYIKAEIAKDFATKAWQGYSWAHMTPIWSGVVKPLEVGPLGHGKC